MKRASFIFISLIMTASCIKKTETSPNYTYIADDLSGTKWSIYQYKDNSTSVPLSRTDTLVFTSPTNYLFNGVSNEYHLEKCESCNNSRLTLRGTSFGDIVGLPPLNFKSTGEILDIVFNKLSTGNSQSYHLWLKKI